MKLRTRYPRMWDDPREYRDGEPELRDVRWREFFALLAGAAAAYVGLWRLWA